MTQGVYVVESEVDEYGFLYGGDELLPIDPASHRWSNAYPIIDRRLDFSWQSGEAGLKPNIFRHNLLRDFVCDRLALGFLERVAAGDLRILGHAFVEGEELSVVQVITVLDVIDEQRSLPSSYSWAKISFPHISMENARVLRRRIFRVVNPELSLMVFVGGDVKSEYERMNLRGWRFELAQVEE